MKFSFLPEEIKVEIDEALGEEPLALSRSNMAIDGHMGEGFLVGYEEIFFLFSKLEGSQTYNKIEGKYPDVSAMSVTKDDKNSIIEIQLGKKRYKMKFSLLEEQSLKALYGAWVAYSLSPFDGLLAALMYLASEDNELASEENDFILKKSFTHIISHYIIK